MLSEICLELENKGWSIVDHFLTDSECHQLMEHLLVKESEDSFRSAGVSRHLNKQVNSSIRDSKIFWINNFEENSALQCYKAKVSDLMIELNQYFFLSMKRFESQFAIYERGGFYKKHVDQHPETRHRQVSCVLYLEDCKEGGELVIYNKSNRLEVDKCVTPRRGRMVVFFSSGIFHEVLRACEKRFSLTSWLRDDEQLPFTI
ncbi:hypothetical protein BIY24_04120 [Halobacteriovorax marinus]|uniref:2OG-Fe(II) oxygenase n=1 Tax=Halobacteriovorax marinus TaxID=97084 RepID=UPI000BC31C06|nr:2OG-Fe(II) oxygenase [Halobacteriovorax marinus]ATH07151.1 hypothetical protein BIY24_04120 [Halobacteriovorax marinus]